MVKDKKYLQDLIEVKEDEIREAKKPKVRKFVEESQFSFMVKEKNLEREKEIEREREK